jgi:hypothetical protein
MAEAHNWQQKKTHRHKKHQSLHQKHSSHLHRDAFDKDNHTVSMYDDASNINGGKSPYEGKIETTAHDSTDHSLDLR